MGKVRAREINSKFLIMKIDINLFWYNFSNVVSMEFHSLRESELPFFVSSTVHRFWDRFKDFFSLYRIIDLLCRILDLQEDILDIQRERSQMELNLYLGRVG